MEVWVVGRLMKRYNMYIMRLILFISSRNDEQWNNIWVMSLTNAIELLDTHKFAQFSSYRRYYKLLNVTPYGTTTIIMDIIIQLCIDYLTLGRLACTCLGQTFFLYIKVRNRSRYRYLNTLNHLNYILFLVISDFR